MRPIIPPAQSDNQFADGYGRWGVIGLSLCPITFPSNIFETLQVSNISVNIIGRDLDGRDSENYKFSVNFKINS